MKKILVGIAMLISALLFQSCAMHGSGTEDDFGVPYFGRPDSSAELIEGDKLKYGVWINKDKWKKEQYYLSPGSTYEFIHTDGDIVRIAVCEKRETVPLPTLKRALRKRMKSVFSNATMKTETRNVSGNKILCVYGDVVEEGVPLTYIAYLYSGKIGSVQIICLTGKYLYWQYERDIADFLNGFVVLERERAS